MKRALFLDRDGVINIEREGSYVLSKDTFIFMDGVLEALAKLRPLFDYVLVVTNQRGVGRGLMTERDLEDIHLYMSEAIAYHGGHLHHIYYAPHMDRDHEDRKPNTGMARSAISDYPDIDFSQSTMVGNNLSDMMFGKKMGMHTVFLHTTRPAIILPHELIDEQHASLWDWYVSLEDART